jgi:hypothetical protein
MSDSWLLFVELSSYAAFATALICWRFVRKRPDRRFAAYYIGCSEVFNAAFSFIIEFGNLTTFRWLEDIYDQVFPVSVAAAWLATRGKSVGMIAMVTLVWLVAIGTASDPIHRLLAQVLYTFLTIAIGRAAILKGKGLDKVLLLLIAVLLAYQSFFTIGARLTAEYPQIITIQAWFYLPTMALFHLLFIKLATHGFRIR